MSKCPHKHAWVYQNDDEQKCVSCGSQFSLLWACDDCQNVICDLCRLGEYMELQDEEKAAKNEENLSIWDDLEKIK